jgi:hypothetical protein
MAQDFHDMGKDGGRVGKERGRERGGGMNWETHFQTVYTFITSCH